MDQKLKIPNRGMGRPTAKKEEAYHTQRVEFANAIHKVNTTLDFSVSSRGWCYTLENMGMIDKSQFDQAQAAINVCRKDGYLPVDICASDKRRDIDDPVNYGRYGIDVEEEITDMMDFDDRIESIVWMHYPVHPTDFQETFIVMIVEKIDLVGLFRPVCTKYGVPIVNFAGWTDLNSRVKLIRLFNEWREKGKHCTVLYCGDYDPYGLQISRFIQDNLRDMESAAGMESGFIEVDRFGLNMDFIEENGLTWIDNLITGGHAKINDLADPRHKNHNDAHIQKYLRDVGPRKVEANALVAAIEAGRQLCEDAVLKYIDPEGVAAYNDELSERRRILKAELKAELARRINGEE